MPVVTFTNLYSKKYLTILEMDEGAYVSTCLYHLRAYLPTCLCLLCDYVPTFLCVLCAYMSICFICLWCLFVFTQLSAFQNQESGTKLENMFSIYLLCN